MSVEGQDTGNLIGPPDRILSILIRNAPTRRFRIIQRPIFRQPPAYAQRVTTYGEH